jgi:transcriptional regulator with XRE-family HTH domain
MLRTIEHAYMMITGAQIRAGRGLLGWTQDLLAYEAGVSVLTVKKIEREKTDPRTSTLGKIEAAFQKAGVIFMDPGVNRDGGAGVRLI